MAFAGKDLKAMCIQVRDRNGLASGDKAQWGAFISHLEGDDLIGMAFEGKRAITDKSPEGPVSAEPPPVDRAAFVQMADKWLREANARCGPWNGTVSQTITHKVISPLDEDVLDVQIDIDVKDGDGTAHVKLTGHKYSKRARL